MKTAAKQRRYNTKRKGNDRMIDSKIDRGNNNDITVK